MIFESATLGIPTEFEDENKAVEDAGQEDEDSVAVPFDPKAIKITPRIISLDMLIKRLANDEIHLNPDFQRLFVWKDERQSRLIESLLLRLPLPAFYFDGKDDSKWEVVDGLQRLSTIKRFVIDKENNLRLTGLEYLRQFEGKSFDELPRDLQRPIEEAPVTAYIIEAGTPDEVKFNLFKRINTGGLMLTAQEIRHALNQGLPATTVKELADDEAFKNATVWKIAQNRMEDCDFTTRFVAFYLLGFQAYEPDMDNFLNKGMKEIKNPRTNLIQLRENFRSAMETAWKIFEIDAFRKRYEEGAKRKPINKALFEVLSVSFARLAADNPERLKILRKRGAAFRKRFIRLMNDSEFDRAITHGTGQKYTVEKRHSKIWEIINETIA
ncbi:MAG: DUF262 domain-containing protein [Saprospiraceae bacterium]